MSAPLAISNVTVASGATLSDIFAMKGRVEAVLVPSMAAAASLQLLVGVSHVSGQHFPLVNPGSGNLGYVWGVGSGNVGVRFGDIAQPFPFGRIQFSAAQNTLSLQLLSSRA